MASCARVSGPSPSASSCATRSFTRPDAACDTGSVDADSAAATCRSEPVTCPCSSPSPESRSTTSSTPPLICCAPSPSCPTPPLNWSSPADNCPAPSRACPSPTESWLAPSSSCRPPSTSWFIPPFNSDSGRLVCCRLRRACARASASESAGGPASREVSGSALPTGSSANTVKYDTAPTTATTSRPRSATTCRVESLRRRGLSCSLIGPRTVAAAIKRSLRWRHLSHRCRLRRDLGDDRSVLLTERLLERLG